MLPLDPQSDLKQSQIDKKSAANGPFDTVGKKPTSPYTTTKSSAVDNIRQANDPPSQAQIIPQPKPADPPIQTAEPQQAPQQQQQAPLDRSAK